MLARGRRVSPWDYDAWVKSIFCRRLGWALALGASACGVTVGQPIDPAPPRQQVDAAIDGGAGTLADGLVGYWKLDETSATDPVLDSSGYGNHGTAVYGPAPSSSRPPVTFADEGSRAFNATTQYVVVGNPEILNFEGAITIAAWVNLIALTNDCQVIVSHGFVYNPPGEVSLRVGGGLCSSTNGVIQWAAGAWDAADHWAEAPFSLGQDTDVWIHLVGVYDLQNWYLYRNGKEVARHPTAIGAMRINGDWGIGGKAPSEAAAADRFFNGSIDEVRIYRRALSPTEVLELYHL